MANHVMVDLETLGRDPWAVIVSLGAVKFDPDSDKLDGDFYANVMIQSCLDAGLSVDGATVQWWMEQPDEARRALFHPDPLPLHAALSGFTEFYRGCEHLWAHGSAFDVPILGAAYRALRQERPWSSRQIRDTRTLFSLVPPSVLEGIQPQGLTHHALHDASHQARLVQAAYRWLRTAHR